MEHVEAAPCGGLRLQNRLKNPRQLERIGRRGEDDSEALRVFPGEPKRVALDNRNLELEAVRVPPDDLRGFAAQVHAGRVPASRSSLQANCPRTAEEVEKRAPLTHLIQGLAERFGHVPQLYLLFDTAYTLNILFIMTCVAIAMLFYDLFDVGMVVRRTLVYGGLTLGVALIYLSFIAAAGVLSMGSNDLLVSLLATGVIALAFQPLRFHLQRGVNRLLYGQRDEPYEVLSDLSQRLGAAPLPASVLPAMTETIARALKLPYVAVALEHTGETRVVAEAGRPTQASVTLPLVYQSERVGELRLGLRVNETRFGVGELKLLRAVAQQASVAAYALRLTGDLQHSRVQLVTTREEERRRLRRDLHDGLGPTLASIIMKLDAARNLAHRDPDAADALLAALKTQGTLADIRQLVYALRPPALDELGLLGALQEQVRKHEGGGLDIFFDAPDTLPALPAAVEVAAYRIVQEALANVLNHAQARRVRVVLRLDAALELEVSDDGVGISPGYRLGVGLHSMRERAEELGGSFSAAPGLGGGVCVRASLPSATLEQGRRGDA